MFDDEKSVFKTQPQAFVSFLIPRRPDIKKSPRAEVEFFFFLFYIFCYILSSIYKRTFLTPKLLR